MKRRIRKFAQAAGPASPQNRRGAVMIEMALVLPVFLMLILGIIEIGQALSTKQLLTNAAREGARVGIFSGATNDEIEEAIEDFLTQALNVSADDITITISVSAAPDYVATFNDVSLAGRRDQVAVTVAIDFDEISYISPTYLSNSRLEGNSVMRHE